MKLIWQCMFSPRLYKVYREGTRESMYQPQGLEKWGDKFISTANAIMTIGLYTSPFICMYIYKRGFYTLDETKSLGRFFGSIGCLLAASFVLRAYGRASNPKYVNFLKALTSPMADKKTYLDGIRIYDFDFQSWPATFHMPPKESLAWIETWPFSTTANSDLPVIQRRFVQFLAFLATHTFGLRLIYPGSLGFLQAMLWTHLFQGRTHLVEDMNGQRAKILTSDGNTIDTMFVDKRNQSPKGKILVVCCEGNSGFYEIGIMTTPAKSGYSALGWNHPGFAGSSGLPYPSQEHHAIDAVMQYAIQELGFQPEHIVMFGWSIGGYAATWAAVNYPVKGLVLDATFDDLLPLAENQMPASWALLVKEVVRSYVDLNISAMITKYDGPVQLVRRTEDEIICLRQGHLASNRGNFLLLNLIGHRHPKVVEDTKSVMYLTKQVCKSEAERITRRSETENEHGHLLPLISKYMHDYRSSHCTPLPEDHFRVLMEKMEMKL